jgi:hypothetical protein
LAFSLLVDNEAEVVVDALELGVVAGACSMVGVPSRGPCPSRAEEACRDATHRLAPVAVAGVGLGQDSDRHLAPAALEKGDLVDEVPERASPPAALEENPQDQNRV